MTYRRKLHVTTMYAMQHVKPTKKAAQETAVKPSSEEEDQSHILTPTVSKYPAT